MIAPFEATFAVVSGSIETLQCERSPDDGSPLARRGISHSRAAEWVELDEVALRHFSQSIRAGWSDRRQCGEITDRVVEIGARNPRTPRFGRAPGRRARCGAQAEVAAKRNGIVGTHR